MKDYHVHDGCLLYPIFLEHKIKKMNFLLALDIEVEEFLDNKISQIPKFSAPQISLSTVLNSPAFVLR